MLTDEHKVLTDGVWGSITLSYRLTCDFMAGRRRSCCLFVLVDQPAQDPPPLDSRRRKVAGRGHGDVVTVRRSQVPAPVRAMPVAMGDILVQGLSLIHISEPTRLGMISYAVFC